MAEEKKPETKNLRYKTAAKSPVEHITTKWDGFKVEATGNPYKHQEGSGRAIVFSMIKDGQTLGTLTKRCAEAGYDSKFVTGSILKHQDGILPAFKLSEKNDKGLTQGEVKKIRDESPERKAKREAAAAAKAEREAVRAAKKAERAQKAEAKKKPVPPKAA